MSFVESKTCLKNYQIKLIKKDKILKCLLRF